ncbi:MAG: hypothetical protein GY749_02740 [Desulfobacteraceae bacterium]|nr:hypothetical protein [Desulfobacteraceae bacterium]
MKLFKLFTLSVCVFLTYTSVLAGNEELTLRLVSKETSNTINTISAASPGRLIATLTDENGDPLANQTIIFSTTPELGSFNPEDGTALTDEQGQAAIDFTAGYTPGTGLVTATSDTSSASLFFTTAGDWHEGLFMTLSLTDSITGDETDTIGGNSLGRLKAMLKDEDGNPVSNKEITFSTTVGIPDPAEAITDADGMAEVSLLPGSKAGAVTVTAMADDTSVSLDFITLSEKITLSIQMTDEATGELTNIISTGLPVQTQATLKDSEGNPIPDQVIAFDATMGKFYPPDNTAATNSEGLASAALMVSESEQGEGTVTATFREYSITVSFVANPPKQANLSLRMTDKSTGYEIQVINAEGPGQVEASLTDENSNPLANRIVTFKTTLGEFFPPDGTVLTDDKGMAVISLLTGTGKDEGEITATYRDESVVLKFTALGNEGMKIELRLLNDAANEITDTVSKDAPGRLEAILTYESGLPVPDKVIQFTVAPELGSFQPESSTALTDESGLATLVLLAGSKAGAAVATAEFDRYSAELAFNTLGDQGGITLALEFAGETDISLDSPGILTATLKDASGNPVADQEVLFSTTKGYLNEAEALTTVGKTNTDGQANAVLLAGWTEGQGEVTASFGDQTAVQSFYTAGDQPKPESSESATDVRSLEHLSLVLQAIGGSAREIPIQKENDINGNGKIGLEEVIYTLQIIRGTR